ncbi:MAG: hypothetical protein LUD72_13875 [Bacteroidales bacterium]|nr:hypothetical protein [Bacteroidales bacterium]
MASKRYKDMQEELVRCVKIMKEQSDYILTLTDKVNLYSFMTEYLAEKVSSDRKEQQKISNDALEYARKELEKEKAAAYAQLGRKVETDTKPDGKQN